VIATVDGADAIIRLVTSDHQRTVNTLREQQLEVQEMRSLWSKPLHRPGLLQHITEKLARENMDLFYLYATRRRRTNAGRFYRPRTMNAPSWC